MSELDVKIYSSKEVFSDVALRCNKPIYSLNDELCFEFASLQGAPKVVVNTIPKSGTYLFAKLFESLGVVNAGVHLSSAFVQDFRFESLETIIENSARFKQDLPLQRSINLLRPGQFAVGHIDFNPETASILKKAKHFFIVRNLRTVMVSFLRFSVDPRRKDTKLAEKYSELSGAQLMSAFLKAEGGNYLKKRIAPILPWHGKSQVLTLRFEDIAGENGVEAQVNCLNLICKQIKMPAPEDVKAFMASNVLGKKTRTWTGKLSMIEDYWSDEVEAIFSSLGGIEMNRLIGYVDEE